MYKVLNVGGNSKEIPLPPEYSGFDHWLLDIDPTGEPDIVCDARELNMLDGNIFDAVYCSHNLEHYYAHDVRRVLDGFMHILKPGGFAHIRVPDLGELMHTLVHQKIGLEEVLYESPAGPITPLDVLYGLGKQIESSGEDFFAHKTGFTSTTLEACMYRAGFVNVYMATGNLEVSAIAFKDHSGELGLKLFQLPAVHKSSL